MKCENLFVEDPLPEELPWVSIMWAVDKAMLLYQLDMPFEEEPLALLQRVREVAPFCGSKRVGLYNCFVFVFLLIVIQ